MDRAHVADLQKQESIKTAADQRFLQLQAQHGCARKTGIGSAARYTPAIAQKRGGAGPILEKRRDCPRAGCRRQTDGRCGKRRSGGQAVNENLLRIEDLKSRLGIIDGQIKQLETRAAIQARDILELSTGRQNQIDEFRRPIKIKNCNSTGTARFSPTPPAES